MTVSSSRPDLKQTLEQIESAYRRSMPHLAAIDYSTLEKRAAYFADAARFSLDHPRSMHRLHCATAGLPNATSAQVLLPAVLAGALTLTNADYGNVQLLDPETGALRIVTQFGFDGEFLDHFAIVDDDSSACGRAAKGGQTVLHDVNEDPLFAAHRGIAAAADFRAVQSTPMTDFLGRMIGVVSTHFRRPHAPLSSDLRIIRLYADFAGDAIASALGGHDDTDPIGRAVVSALLDPGRSGPADVPIHDLSDAINRPAAPLSPITPTFAGYLMNRLSTVALHLAGTQNLIRHPVARTRLEAAVDQLDQTIREVQSSALSSVSDSGRCTLVTVTRRP
ncbi:GAF domain-containing protein [Nocardia sp. NPDC046473]|uniref:GAF domain-containing protein n=1 Tax=Nocardia sp. NPDC046473 TaxID=3155733 RepID=UPI0033F65D68